MTSRTTFLMKDGGFVSIKKLSIYKTNQNFSKTNNDNNNNKKTVYLNKILFDEFKNHGISPLKSD